jgi:hypothetical protein
MVKVKKPNPSLVDPHGIFKEPDQPWERPSHWKIPATLGEEVEQALAEWYGRRGLPVPPEEIGIGARIDAEESALQQQQLNSIEETQKNQDASPAGEKPEFGTPEFWAWARKRKKEKDAERAKQGLPPLPTKKEKEAEKAKKVAEREAKKALKK